MSSAIRWFALGGLAWIALVTAACGGGMSDAERAECRGTIIDGAAARVVINAYEAGRLGTQVEVEHALGSAGARFFTSDGHLRPYSSLKSDALVGAFNEWMYGDPRVLAATKDQQEEAQRRVFPVAERECS